MGHDTRGAPIDPVTDASGQGALSMRLIPVGLVPEHLALLSMQQFGHLRDVTDVRRGRAQTVDDAVPVAADVRFQAKMPVFTLLRLTHLRITRALLILGRRRRGDDGRIHDRAALEQQSFLFKQGSDLGKDLLSQ
jgi:hypothetical protein